MNPVLQPDSPPEVPWPTHRTPAAEPPTSSVFEKAPQVAVDSLNRVVQGAHDAVDRFAEGAGPKVRQLGENVSRAETALGHGTARLGRAGDAWTESVRGTVRSHPLTAIAAAVALGAVIARATR